MPVLLLQGEWAEGSGALMGFEEARDRGCQEYADQQKKTTFSRERTMTNWGLAAYIQVPEKYDSRVQGNSDNGDLDDILGEQRRHKIGKNWTGGLYIPSEQVFKDALEVCEETKAKLARLQGPAHAALAEMMGPPRIAEVAQYIDFGKCERRGPVLTCDAGSHSFQDSAPKDEKMRFLVALFDPHAYGYTAASVGEQNRVYPGFRGSQTGYAPASGQTTWEDGTRI
ncbi:hypothetical protein [Streptomyces sp. NPDC057939]|uniref:hypothetical protein n=1 Tax=Streptomyces sp. NPDC057939 TaxID=3346284 RepID=UPI0036EBFFFE